MPVRPDCGQQDLTPSGTVRSPFRDIPHDPSPCLQICAQPFNIIFQGARLKVSTRELSREVTTTALMPTAFPKGRRQLFPIR